MADEMRPAAPAPSWAAAVAQLPTLQRNALRKIFDRREFSPAEVAELGYHRLRLADGIGNKGLVAIAAWLVRYGCELKAPERPPPGKAPPARKTRRSIEQALRILRAHGYDVVEPGEAGGS